MKKYANKSASQQTFRHGEECRSNSFHRELHEFNRAKQKEVKEQNGCCLTCRAISAQRGIVLFCSLKQKTVRQYNYCEKYLAINSESTESKEETKS